VFINIFGNVVNGAKLGDVKLGTHTKLRQCTRRKPTSNMFVLGLGCALIKRPRYHKQLCALCINTAIASGTIAAVAGDAVRDFASVAIRETEEDIGIATATAVNGEATVSAAMNWFKC
jgi:hypothetical protein